MEGWISLYRKFINWEWYTDINVKIVFIHLLLLANHTDNLWNGIVIKRGQLVTSSENLAKDLNLSRQQVRTALCKLQTTNEITTKSTNKYMLITIEKYNDYQDGVMKNNQQNNQQSNHQITTNNNDNNIYLYLLNKYRRENRMNFNEYLKKVSAMKQDDKWNELTEDEQQSIICEI